MLEHLMSLIQLFFVVIFFIVLTYKFYIFCVATLAFPTYLALFGIEYLIVNAKNKTEKNLFRLNVPKKIEKKITMNTIASIITIINVFIIDKYVLSFYTIVDDDFFIKLTKVFAISYIPILVIGFCILIIYSISYFEEVDEKTAKEKIIDLQIPSLWKEVIKD